MSPTRLLSVVILCCAALPAAARPADCYLSVDGKDIINGSCDFEQFGGDGSFQISSWDGSFFAVVNVYGDGVAQGWWNGGAYATHAHTGLGPLRRSDACWLNDFVSVCAW
jgi:hypothetical protein